MSANLLVNVSNFPSERFVGSIRNIAVGMGEFKIPHEFLNIDESQYEVIVRLRAMVQPRAQTNYYRFSLKIHLKEDAEIHNYE